MIMLTEWNWTEKKRQMKKYDNKTLTKKIIVPSYDVSWEYKIVNILTKAKFTWKKDNAHSMTYNFRMKPF